MAAVAVTIAVAVAVAVAVRAVAYSRNPTVLRQLRWATVITNVITIGPHCNYDGYLRGGVIYVYIYSLVYTVLYRKGPVILI